MTAPDRATDVRNFYLADDRVRHQAARDLLRRRLGGMTLDDLVKKAEAKLKADPQLEATPEGYQLAGLVGDVRSSRQLYAYRGMGAMLRLAGVNILITWGPVRAGHMPAKPNARQRDALSDLVAATDVLLSPLKTRTNVPVDVAVVASPSPAESPAGD